jgi:anti-sigma regulatory factor (Ser/Thr protein kinase)
MKPTELPGDLNSLEIIREYVRGAAADAGLERKQAYRLSLAVDEIATNIVLHGYQEAGMDGNIRISATLSESTLTIVLEDDAVPYDPHQSDNPDDLDAPLEEREIGGLGVFLAIQYVDEFRYERIANRNRHTFIIKANNKDSNTGVEAG